MTMPRPEESSNNPNALRSRSLTECRGLGSKESPVPEEEEEEALRNLKETEKKLELKRILQEWQKHLTREESMAAICFACDSEALSTGDDDAGTAPCSGCEMIAMEEVTLSASPMSLRQLTVATATAAVAGFFPSRRRRGLVPLG